MKNNFRKNFKIKSVDVTAISQQSPDPEYMTQNGTPRRLSPIAIIIFDNPDRSYSCQ